MVASLLAHGDRGHGAHAAAGAVIRRLRVAVPGALWLRWRKSQGAFVMAEAAVEPIGWERALMAAEKVKERLRRATRALDAAGVPYAVVGGNAVAEWVARVDEDAVRNTRDVDLLIRRPDFPAARACLEAVGFIYHELLDIDTFIDGPQGKPSGGIHLLFAGEKVRRDDDYHFARNRRIGTSRRISGRHPRSLGADEVDLLARQGPSSPSRHDRRRPSRRDLARPLPGTARRSLAAIAR